MLTFIEMINYNIMYLFLLVFAVGLLIFSLIFLIKTKTPIGRQEIILISICCIIIVFLGVIITNTTVTTQLITPCSIYVGFVADADGNLYYTLDEELLIKLNVNQTSDVKLLHGFMSRYPKIVGVCSIELNEEC